MAVFSTHSILIANVSNGSASVRSSLGTVCFRFAAMRILSQIIFQGGTPGWSIFANRLCAFHKKKSKIWVAGFGGAAPVGGLQCQAWIVVESPTNKNPQLFRLEQGLGPSAGARPWRYSSIWRQRWGGSTLSWHDRCSSAEKLRYWASDVMKSG